MTHFKRLIKNAYKTHLFCCLMRKRFVKKLIICLTAMIFFSYLLPYKQTPNDGYIRGKRNIGPLDLTISLNPNSNNLRMHECMSRQSENVNLKLHPGAPINSLPPFYQYFLPISANTTICDPARHNLRVLVILTRPWKREIRIAIRNTYANFTPQREKNLTSWTKVFVVGSPRSETEKQTLYAENMIFNDILVANISEKYSLLTLKLLVAMKFISCVCTNAEYFVKADDDICINIAALDREITKTENSVAERRKPHHHNVELRAKPAIYLGHSAGKDSPVVRPPPPSKYAVSWEVYSENFYPEYMIGFVYVLSMSLVQKLAIDCPYHCISLSTSKTNLTKPCFWKFEDIFIGSCISHSQPGTLWAGKENSVTKNNWEDLWFLVTNWVETGTKPVHLHNIKSPQGFYLIHSVMSLLEKYPHNHPIKNLLPNYFHNFNSH